MKAQLPKVHVFYYKKSKESVESHAVYVCVHAQSHVHFSH